jgi:hypothetical protein
VAFVRMGLIREGIIVLANIAPSCVIGTLNQNNMQPGNSFKQKNTISKKKMKKHLNLDITCLLMILY